jgi:Flp pilus assembly protein TadD
MAMTPYQTALQQAMAAQARGEWEAAEKFCQRALLADPRGFDARHLLGFIQAQMGKHYEALREYERALLIKPQFGPLHNNIAAGRLELNQPAEALSAACRALELQPDFGPAFNNRALALARLGRHGEAVDVWEKAEHARDAPAAIFRNKSFSLLALGRLRDALETARRAVEREQRSCASLNCLAFALIASRDFVSAERVSRDALDLQAGNADALKNLSSALIGLRDFATAEPVLDELRKRFPDDPDVENNFGLLLLGQQRLDTAEQVFRSVVSRCPQHVRARLNLLCVLRDANRPEAAHDVIAQWRTDVLPPPMAHTLGMICLSLGLFEEGWQRLESRRLLDTWRPRVLQGAEPRDADDIRGRRLLLYAEQGLRDTIQFARYAALLAGEAASVQLEVRPQIVALLSGLHKVQVIGHSAAPVDYDVHLPLLSAPRLLNTRLETIPADIPYIMPDPVRAAEWGQRIGGRGFKIGIAWQGDPLSAAEEGRSFPVGLFGGIGRIPGVRLISLQKNAGLEQLLDLPEGLTIETLGEDLDAGDQAFLDTAAVMEHLDLVVSCDTAIAHLAGAMGRPVWLALRHAPDWRWLVDREDSPWYPTARLFRQPSPGDWRSVFQDMARAVVARLDVAWSDAFLPGEVVSAGADDAARAEAMIASGDMEGAIRVCQAGLETNPAAIQLRQVLAVALAASGRRAEAVGHFEQVLKARPHYLLARTNLAYALNGLARYDEALSALGEEGPPDPALLPAWLDARALAYAGLLQHDRAQIDWRQATALAPQQPSYRLNWAMSLSQQKRFREAVEVLDPLLEARPEHEAALNLRIRCLLDASEFGLALDEARTARRRLPQSPVIARVLATCLIEDGAHGEALEILTDPASSADGSAETELLLGKIHDRASNWREAAEAYGAAVSLAPELADAWFGLGVAQGKLGDCAAWLQSLRSAVELNPTNASVRAGLAIARQNNGDWQGARADFEKAYSLDPQNVDVRWNFALHYLTTGDLRRGFELYEARRHRRGIQLVRDPGGEEARLRLDMLGRRLLVLPEQGLGDTIQFCRYAELLARDALSVELEVQPPLVSLLSQLKGVRIIPVGARPSVYDFHVPLMSLPRLFGTQLETIPAAVPYIHAQRDRVRQWASRLRSGGVKIAIAWQGSSFGSVDEGRSFPLRMFQKISEIPGVRLISIQKNFGVEQLADLPAGMAVESLGADFDAGDQAFLDTAAVIEHCDLVITSDTSIAHLAGAMGKPVWIALKFAPDWRWLLERSDSPWYPTARLFRQPRPGDWEGVFAQLTEAVREMARDRR